MDRMNNIAMNKLDIESFSVKEKEQNLYIVLCVSRRKKIALARGKI